MAISEIIQLNLQDRYEPEIIGLGEIYEKMSVFHLQKKLRKKYKDGVLFLSSNKDHRGKGFTLDELKFQIKSKGYQILYFGYVDSPPWASYKVKSDKKSPYLKSWIIILAKLLFWFLIQIEFIWQGKRSSHMVVCLGRFKI